MSEQGPHISRDVSERRIPVLNSDSLTVAVSEDESVEDLQLSGLRLIQKKKAFRFGMDSVLLAHFSDIRPEDTVADLGTGNGILPLLLIGRNKGKHFYGVEILKDAADLAVRNTVLNQLTEIISVIHADAGEVHHFIKPCSIDAVVCNPPYGQPASSLTSPIASIASARTQETDTLDRFFTGAFRILKGKGRLFLVYPATQMLHVMKRLQSHHLEPKRFRLVYPYADKPPNIVLIEALKDARPTLQPLPPLIVYEKDGTLTNELKFVYHIEEQTKV